MLRVPLRPFNPLTGHPFSLRCNSLKMLKRHQQSQTNGKGEKREEGAEKSGKDAAANGGKGKIREWVKVNTLTLAQRSVLAGKWSRGPDLGRFSHPPNASSAQLSFTPTSIHLTECISSRLLPRFLCLFAQCVFSWLHCSQWVRKAGKSGKNRGKRQWKIGTWWGKMQ